MILFFLAAMLPVICVHDCVTEGRKKLDEPKVESRINEASATRSPWIISNGAKILRNPTGKYYYNFSSAHSAAMAVVESFVFAADAVVQITGGETADAEKMKTFIASLPSSSLPPVVDLVVVDDGSDQTGEVMNLLVRRNLLFRPVKKADGSKFSVQIGTKDFPKLEAANPSDFAILVRKKLTDEKRSLRVYGSENVIARLDSDGKTARLHVLNYGQRPVEGIRIRVRGVYKNAAMQAFGIPNAKVEEMLVDGDSTEFSITELRQYAVVDLR